MDNISFDSPHIEQAIAENGEIMASTAGVSMYPMLRNRRDMVVIERVNRALKPGDVPLYRLGSGKLVLHRILKVTDNGYVIRGDNLLDKEYNVKYDSIIGVLKAFYRNGKYYDCENSKSYKLYVALIRVSFPLRFLWKAFVRPTLGKLKRLLFKRK